MYDLIDFSWNVGKAVTALVSMIPTHWLIPITGLLTDWQLQYWFFSIKFCTDNLITHSHLVIMNPHTMLTKLVLCYWLTSRLPVHRCSEIYHRLNLGEKIVHCIFSISDSRVMIYVMPRLPCNCRNKIAVLCLGVCPKVVDFLRI